MAYFVVVVVVYISKGDISCLCKCALLINIEMFILIYIVFREKQISVCQLFTERLSSPPANFQCETKNTGIPL